LVLHWLSLVQVLVQKVSQRAPLSLQSLATTQLSPNCCSPLVGVGSPESSEQTERVLPSGVGCGLHVLPKSQLVLDAHEGQQSEPAVPATRAQARLPPSLVVPLHALWLVQLLVQ
jgi:hypothetical protein